MSARANQASPLWDIADEHGLWLIAPSLKVLEPGGYPIVQGVLDDWDGIRVANENSVVNITLYAAPCQVEIELLRIATLFVRESSHKGTWWFLQQPSANMGSRGLVV